ncbi:MAG: 6,7-dimethyl-8-ribityllumazine synthase [Bacteroidales bacterium]|nr:6,7-dimethyl-8-ribityllumazine synthase [Bacteroidales bacterium]
MTEKKHNLSDYDSESVPDASEMTFGIVVSEWNKEITFALLEGALETLKAHQVKHENIVVKYVPGSFEIPLAAHWILEHHEVDAVICLGCIIQGETRHFDFVCKGVTDGIMRLNLQYSRPVIFGILTTDNFEQAKERAGGKNGNKGVEAAIAAIKMIKLSEDISGA